MTKKTLLTAGAVLALATAAAGCGGGGSDNAASPTTTGAAAASSVKTLVGAGSSFVYPLVTNWIKDYSEKQGVTVTYGPIGSGGGIQSISSNTVDFGASDAPLTAEQAGACSACLQIPWALAGTSLPYNVPGAPKHLKLDGAAVAGIFLGTITNWNDPAIARLNPGWQAPDLKIVPVHRSDSSGTTYNFTDYLEAVSPQWKSEVGHGTLVSFPGGTGAKGSSGVTGVVAGSKGAITYVDAAYSIQNDLSYAAVENAAGAFVLPTTAAVAAAAKSVTTIPDDLEISIVDPPASAAKAYPIATFTYVIVRRDSPKAKALRAFVEYAISDGQPFGPDLQFVPLAQRVVDADRRALAGLG